MPSKVTFVNSPYSGYHYNEMRKEDEELTHVGPSTPCGEYLRRFWQPVIFLDEFKDLPVRERILGEDLVVFRDRRGQLGVLKLHCSHRGASLEFGQIAERGIRCCYHGWLYDVDGKILDMPGEPPESRLRESFYHGAYPTHVHEGLVFIYMGPPERKPAFPIYDTYRRPEYRPWVGVRHVIPCNWLQIKENSMDPAHLSFLHTIDGAVGFPTELKLDSVLDYIETPIGMAYIATRRVGDKIWVRMSDFICPNIHQFGPFNLNFSEELARIRPEATFWSVPVDDTHTTNFRMRFVRKDDNRPPILLVEGQEEGVYEKRQRVPGDYDAQVNERPIAIYGHEHLGTTDRGVVLLRKMLREGIRAARSDKDVKGVATKENGVIPTYASDIIVRIPQAATPEADKKLVRETGRKIAKDFVANPVG